MRFIMFIFLVGCTGPQELYEEVNNNCPPMCYKYNQKWTGLIKVYTEGVKCICEQVK